MTKDDTLHIFHTFWPSEGYAGIARHLPDWSKSRASNFAWRNGIKMNDEAKRDLAKSLAVTNLNRHHGRAKPKPVPVKTSENRLLMGKW